ncbi:MAG: hypothetical protein HC875_33590 [Anaerolineales bacterium]|nr:hypothetical protein [Anaerolineales bacterium]
MDDLDALFALYRDPENEASRRVAQKIGMALEKEMMLDDAPALVFSMDRPGSSEI